MTSSSLRPLFMALLLSIAVSSQAAAAQIDFTGVGKGANIVFTVDGSPLGSNLHSFAGELNWNWLGGTPAGYASSIYSYCVDATQWLADPQTVSIESTNALATPSGGSDAGHRVAWLINTFASTVHASGSGEDAAALQVAIWETLYDPFANLAGGKFTLATTGTIQTKAASYLSGLSDPGAYASASATFLNTSNGQDQVLMTPASLQAQATPVPEPSTLLLLGAGLAGSHRRIRAALARRG